MSPDPHSRFSQIATLRELLGDGQALLDRYQVAIRGYLHAVLGDPALVYAAFLRLQSKVLDGTLAGGWRGTGRFRNYLKSAVGHAATDVARDRVLNIADTDPDTPLEDFDPADYREPSRRSSWLVLYRQTVVREALARMAAEPKQAGYYRVVCQLLEAAGETQDRERLTLPTIDRQQRRRALTVFRAHVEAAVRPTLDQPDCEAELADELGLLGFGRGSVEPDATSAEEADDLA